jgi:hypothetical protein
MTLFLIVSFLSSFLLFTSEPLVIKYLLPFLGGGSSVWTIGVLLFQTLLFLGYLYSYKLTSFQVRMQKVINISFLSVVIILQYVLSKNWIAPILPKINQLNVGSSSPEVVIIVSLALGVGLPYLFLSTSNTLLHYWYEKATQKSPYWLYQISNLGGLVAVFGYPIFIDPVLTVQAQGVMWFWLFILCIIFLTFILRTSVQKSTVSHKQTISDLLHNKNALWWIVLSATPSFIMLSVTNYITQGISPIPLLWLLPLGLYLLSFIIGFTQKVRYFKYVIAAVYVCTLSAALLRFLEVSGFAHAPLSIFVSFTMLLSLSILCHHMLFLKKPDQSGMSGFYVFVTAGGMLGGIVVGVLAPFLFKSFWEVELSFVFSFLLFFAFAYQKIPKQLRVKYVGLLPFRELLLIVCLTSITLLAYSHYQFTKSASFINRNFYGVSGVREKEEMKFLFNGAIIHGSQYKSEDKKNQATTYYAVNSGVDIAFKINRNEKEEGLTVGAVGLGVGTIATYCLPSDSFVFYEINPTVTFIAKNYFSYLESCRQASIVQGDARLSIQNEKGMNPYDILILDAFSDDAIPVHLITKEAFELYNSRLGKEAILAIHISNNNIELAPPLKRIAKELNFNFIVVNKTEAAEGELPSIWVLLSKDERLFEKAKKTGANIVHEDKIKEGKLWTDNYSSIFSALKFSKTPAY